MPNRRRSGQIIAKGKDKWLVRYCLGRDKETGKRIYQSETVLGNKGEAQAVLNRKFLEIDTGRIVRKSNISLKQYLDEWLTTIAKARVREVTYDSYCYHLNHYVYSALGGRLLRKLTGFEVQRFINSLREKYSPRTVQYVHTILKNALTKAVEMRLIADNPCTFVALPKKSKRGIRVFTPSEARRFLTAANNDPLGLVFEFALLTGARPEEYLALKWQDVDWHRQSVTFQRALIWRKGGGWYFDEEMKTSSSRRTIPLPSTLVAKLRAYRTTQAEAMLRIGSLYERNDIVFANEIGRPLHSGNITKRNFQPILAAAGLGHHRLYSLRHSCATLLLSQGENIKVVQERLGHSDVVLTLSTYSHVLEGMQSQASDRLSTLFYQRDAVGAT